MAGDQDSGGILSREWRILKPLPWLMLSGAAALAAALWVLPMFRNDKPPAPLVIHKDEKLAPADIDFEIVKDIPAASGDFKPLLAYRVTPKEGKTFSHPFTLNFQGDALKQVTDQPIIARWADNQWTQQPPPQSKVAGSGTYYAIELKEPGVYALGQAK